MKFRDSILSLIGLGAAAVLVGCGGSSAPPVTKQVAPPITVTVGTAPTSIYVNDKISLSANVANDAANAGVTWSCAPTGSCGSFNATKTASGAAVTYTAPATTGSVIITATSVTSPSISNSTPSITISPASGIEITLSKAAQWSLTTGGLASISATVTNDPANAGVNWSCTPAASCGSFSPAQTASGTATSYTASATAGTVVITATSVTDDAQSASTTVSLGSSPTLADGNYVYTLSGMDTDADGQNLFYAAGAIAVKGGAITGGEQDWGDYFGALSDQINGAGSSISITPDGNLQIVLQSCSGSDCTHTDTSLGVNGVETLNASLVSSSRALITEFDAYASASGTLDLQTSTAPPSGGYAFSLNGAIIGDYGTDPLAIGGVLNVDGSGTISGKGSVFDVNNYGYFYNAQYADQALAASTVSTPDANGRVVVTLNPASAATPQIVLAGYIVDATHIRLVELLDPLGGFAAGTAFRQTGAGGFSAASISGNSYVMQLSGQDLNGYLQVAGVLTANPNGTVSGTVNYNDLTGSGSQPPSTIVGGTYTVDPTGRVTLSNVTDGIVTFDLQLYLDGNGNAPSLDMDANDALGGMGYQQAGGGSFTADYLSGTYVMNATGIEIPTGTPSYNLGEFDSVGPIKADGVGSFAGFADLNSFNGSPYQGIPAYTVPVPDLAVSGTFSAAPSGVFTGSVSGLNVNSSTDADTYTYYMIDPTRVVAIETDSSQLSLGYFELESQP